MCIPPARGTLFGKLPTRHQQGDLNYFQPIPGKVAMDLAEISVGNRGDMIWRYNHKGDIMGYDLLTRCYTYIYI